MLLTNLSINGKKLLIYIYIILFTKEKNLIEFQKFQIIEILLKIIEFYTTYHKDIILQTMNILRNVLLNGNYLLYI